MDLCILVGLGFPGASYLSLAKVIHEAMKRELVNQIGLHECNSPEISLPGSAATKSTRKVLKSSPWTHQLLIDFAFNNIRRGPKIRFELKANIGNLCSDAGVEFACEDCKNQTSRFSDLDFSGRMRIALSALLRQ